MNIEKIDLSLQPSPIDTRDWCSEELLAKLVLPTKYDLRPYLQEVRDQENQGTCSAQAVSCMKEYQEYKNISLDEYMSPQFIYSKRADPTKEGMVPRNTIQILQQFGICRERTYPYGIMKPNTYLVKKAEEEALNFRIQNYAQVDTVEGLKTAIVQNGVCYIAVPVYNYGTRLWKRDDADPTSTYKGNHAMAIVGYDDFKQSFIIRNSWGKNWGENGYCYFPYTDWGCQWEVWTTIDETSTVPKFWYDYKKYRLLKQIREFFVMIYYAPLNTVPGFAKLSVCCILLQQLLFLIFPNTRP